MSEEILGVQSERFHLLDRKQYIVQGYLKEADGLHAYLDDKKLPITVTCSEKKYEEEEKISQITAVVLIPDDISDFRKLVIYTEANGKKNVWFSISVKALEKKRDKPQVYFEEEKIQQGNVRLKGWTIADRPVMIRVYDEKKKPVNAEIKRTDRIDVTQLYSEVENPGETGFYMELAGMTGNCLYVLFQAGNKKSVKKISLKKSRIIASKIEKYAEKGYYYWKNQGNRALMRKLVSKLKRTAAEDMSYQKWRRYHMPDKRELEQQRKTKFSYNPKISIVVPLYKTPEKYLRKLVDSVQKQTYENWELCLSDGSGSDSPIKSLLQELSAGDKRIRIVSHEHALQISENTNSAIEIATGDFIAFADHDDELAPHALFECAKILNERPETKILYSDEDKMSMDGRRFFEPNFKSDFNPQLLCTVNYICHLFVASSEVIRQVGMLRREFDGAQDYDFIFRCTERVKEEEIVHIPKILYHWRCHMDSTAENPESKRYAFEAGKRAIESHYQRVGIKADVELTEHPGWYRSRVAVTGEPLISIIIPNKDHIQDLELCISSIEEKSTWKNYEIIIAENNSEKAETFAYYEELSRKYPNVRVLTWEKEFNYAAINNFAVKHAEGEYVLFLNNDVEIITDSWMEEMLQLCQQKGIGIVGAKLYYPDDTIQHAGVVIGLGGIAGHVMCRAPRYDIGYMGRMISVQDISAVTGACMMVKTSAFIEAGGFDEKFKVAFNDIDLCMKIRNNGDKVVFTPYAELYHYESKSRGMEDTPEKIARFNKEIALFEKKWPDILKKGDPYYNPNLTLKSQFCYLKQIQEGR